MKRMLCLLLCLLLFPLAVQTAADGETDVTVRVLLSSGGADTVTVKLSGKYAVGDRSVTGGTVTASIADGVITVSHSTAGVLKTTDTVTRLRRVGTDAETKLTFDNAKHGTRVYYGDFVFYNDGGTLRVINYVDLKNYLYGVVSGEMSDSSKPDLLKVETICAKCFVLTEIEGRKTKYFDVYDTTSSQLYYGYVATDTNTIAAVDAVWTQTLLYNGNVVKTYYSTADGGQIITPRIRWGGTANDGAYWFGYDPFDLMGSSKNVILTIDGASPKQMNADLYAFLLAKTDTKEIVSVDSLTGVYDPDNPSGSARYPSTLAPQKRYDWKLTVKTGDGTKKQVSFSCTPDEVKAAAAPSAAGTVCFCVHTLEKEWKLVWGVSSGHRAGLSHRGAGQMVRQGYSYVDVLKFYFRGATLFDANGKAIESHANFAFTYEDGATSPAPSTTPSPTGAPTPTPPPSGKPDHDVIVTEKTLNLYEKASTGSKVKETLSLGAILGVYSETGDWAYVIDDRSGKTGYVHSDGVSYYERKPVPRWEGVCNADDTNLRSGPSTNFSKYWPLNKGDKVYVYYQSGNWYFVMDRATGQGAFIYKTYVTKGGSVPSFTRGDADRSGSVGVTDASLVLRYLVKLSPLADEALLAADYTRDGTVNASDASAILRRAAGLE
ncbi:MAG: SH3 domain-containing protein [Clostridia bacterium]|nr:SH3 domain-containing protein [Clostridia bacterium]